MRNIKLLDIIQLVLAQLYIERTHRLIKVFCLCRSEDRRSHSPRPVPRKGYLRHPATMLFGKLGDTLYNFNIVLLCPVIFAHCDTVGFAPERIGIPGWTCKMTRRQCAVRHQRNAHLLAYRDKLPLVLAVKEIIVILHRREWRPAVVSRRQLHVIKLVAVHCRSAQGSDLACLNKRIESLHCLLNARSIPLR